MDAPFALSHGRAMTAIMALTASPIASPPSAQASTAALTARSRCGVTSSVEAIVPWRYSPAAATTPSTSVSRPRQPVH